MAFGARFLKRFIDEHDQAADQRALEGRLALRGDGSGRRRSSSSRRRRKLMSADGRSRSATSRESVTSAKPTCSGSAVDVAPALFRRSRLLRLLEPVALLQHPHHALHFFAVGVRRVLSCVQLLEPRQPSTGTPAR